MDVRVKLGHSDASIRGPGGELVFSLTRGTFTILDSVGAPAVCEATSRVVLGATPHALTAGYRRMAEGIEVTDAFGRGMALRVLCEPEGAAPRLTFTATRYDDTPGVFLSLECGNTLGAPQELVALEVVSARSSAGATVDMFPYPPAVRFFNTGATMAGSPFVDLARPPLDLKAWADSTASELMGCFAKDSTASAALLAGFVSAGRLPSQVRFGLEPGGDRWADLVAVSECEGRPFPQDACATSETLYVSVHEPALAAMERYASLIGRGMGARRNAAMPTGWSGWSYYYTALTQDDLRANLKYLADHRDRYPVTHVTLDEGYQTHWGDWTGPSTKFPAGMKALADEIRSSGFIPGLWVAPFVVSPASAVAKAHPDWLVPGATGLPLRSRGWGVECPWYSLDGTHPGVQAHLESTFGVIAGEWGYGHVKLDAMHVGAPPGGMFHDPRATRYEAYRRGLEAIRRGCGDAFVTGCNAPFGPSVGLVDGMRVSMDVAPEWGATEGCNVKSALRSSARRWFFNRRLWWNDPDALIVRAPSPTRVCHQGDAQVKRHEPMQGLTGDEARTLASVIGLLGGMLYLSDDLPSLAAERAQIHDLVFPVHETSARPLDLFETDPPSVLLLDVTRPWESWKVVSVTNWGDVGVNRSLCLDDLALASPSARHHVFSLFERHYYGAVKGVLRLGVIPPHGTRVVAIRESCDRPQLIGSTFHLTQGAHEIESCRWSGGANALNLALSVSRSRSGTLFFHVPAEFGTPVLAGSAHVAAHRSENGVLAVDLVAEPRASLDLVF